jgi:hypothetical protein
MLVLIRITLLISEEQFCLQFTQHCLFCQAAFYFVWSMLSSVLLPLVLAERNVNLDEILLNITLVFVL